MQKITLGLVSLIFGLFLFGCAEQTPPIATEESATEATEATEPVVSEPVTQTQEATVEPTENAEAQIAKSGDFLVVNYVGKFEDGTVFDQGTDFHFTLDSGQVIPGWDKEIMGMRVGEKKTFSVPPSLGYGEAGYGPIPGGTTLIFDVELVEIRDMETIIRNQLEKQKLQEEQEK